MAVVVNDRADKNMLGSYWSNINYNFYLCMLISIYLKKVDNIYKSEITYVWNICVFGFGFGVSISLGFSVKADNCDELWIN